MTDIKVQPDALEDSADRIRDHASRIQDAIDAVDTILRAIGPDAFSGHRADALRARYNQMHDQLMTFCPMLTEFASKLDDTATSFRNADRANSNYV